MLKLKRCPFCGGKAEVRAYSGTLQFVQCVDCLSCSGAFFTDKEAIDAWNQRNTLLIKLKKVLKKVVRQCLKKYLTD